MCPIFQLLLFSLICCFFLVLFGYKYVPKVKYYVKFTVYHVSLVFFATIVIPVAIFRPRKSDNVRMCTWLLLNLEKFLEVELVEVRNKEILNTAGPFVLVVNHQSSLDLFSFSHVWPARCVCIIKRELLFFGPFGFACWLCGAIGVDRVDPTKARGTMDRAAKEVTEKNLILLIFPEGTRNHGDGMLPFKKGAFNIAVKAQIPVVPLVISSYKTFMDPNKPSFGKGKFIISLLPPVSTVGLEYTDVNDLSERVRCQMLAEFNKISKEVDVLSSNAADKKSS